MEKHPWVCCKYYGSEHLRHSSGFPITLILKRSGLSEEANTTFVQQIQEFRASSEVLFALGAKALFIPLPRASGDKQHLHNPSCLCRPSKSKQPSILTGLFGTESEESDLQVNPSETFKSQCSTWMSAFLFPLFKHYTAVLNGGLRMPAQPTSVPCEQHTDASPAH